MSLKIHEVKDHKVSWQFGDNAHQLHLKWSSCLSLSRYSNPKTTHFLVTLLLARRCWRRIVQIRSLFMRDTESQGPKHNSSTVPVSLNSDFWHPLPCSRSPTSAPLRLERHLPPHSHLNSHVSGWTYAHAFSQFSVHAVRHSRPHAIFIHVMQMKNIKTQESI